VDGVDSRALPICEMTECCSQRLVQLTRNALRLVALRRSRGSAERTQRIPSRNFIGYRTNHEHRIKRLSSSVTSYYLHIIYYSCTKVGHEWVRQRDISMHSMHAGRTYISFGELVKKLNFFSVARCRQLGASPPFRAAFTDAYMG